MSANNNPFQLIQQGYQIAVGATATLLETLQDPQKRESALSELQSQWNQRTQEWLEKGEVTEQEARRTVEQLFNKQKGTPSSETASSSSPTTVTTPPSDTRIQTELKNLTDQIIALRTELEQSRQSDQ